MQPVIALVLLYLFIGLFLWVALPAIDGVSGKRPKLWRMLIAWGPAVVFPISGPVFRNWIWRK